VEYYSKIVFFHTPSTSPFKKSRRNFAMMFRAEKN